MQLTSKLQYKRSEKGEFHDIAMRDLDETIALILSYPWDTERSLASVELTCPSVTVEHVSGSYLKIGPYFSGKYSLYYLDTKRRVYLKTVGKLEEACEWVKIYFEQKGQLQGLDRYGFTISPYKHFETNSFVYQVNTAASLRLLKFVFIMIGVAILISSLKYIDQTKEFRISSLLYSLILFTLIFSPLFYLYFNYLDADRNSYLQISKGHDDFSFGTSNTRNKYSKQEISSIICYGAYYTKSLWRECEVFLITFKNGEQIKFTSLLILGSTLRNKFPDHKTFDQKKFFPTFQSV